MDSPKVAELVRLNLPQLLEYCAEDDPDEIANLMDKAYCSETFRLNFAFLKTPAEAERIKSETKYARYWVKTHHVLDHEVRATSQWYPRQRAPFLLYLLDKGLTPIGVPDELLESEIDKLTVPPVSSKLSAGGARFRKTPIGNAQNAAVRNVLGSLGQEPFTQKDWLGVKRWFHHRCAYCSSMRQLVMDHAVPISIDALGEHKLGNLVPACHDCNTAKGQARYDEYLRPRLHRANVNKADAAARLSTIEAHMSHHGYEPLFDVLSAAEAEKTRDLLRELRQRVAASSEGTMTAINHLLAHRSDPAS